jgi:hypothetical protein
LPGFAGDHFGAVSRRASSTAPGCRERQNVPVETPSLAAAELRWHGPPPYRPGQLVEPDLGDADERAPVLGVGEATPARMV